jgi:hypothetical protein
MELLMSTGGPKPAQNRKLSATEDEPRQDNLVESMLKPVGKLSEKMGKLLSHATLIQVIVTS